MEPKLRAEAARVLKVLCPYTADDKRNNRPKTQDLINACVLIRSLVEKIENASPTPAPSVTGHKSERMASYYASGNAA
ncbi:MAG TPA: hypothetical protein VGH47_00095 [Xanthobacteraceae bacterium]